MESILLKKASILILIKPHRRKGEAIETKELLF